MTANQRVGAISGGVALAMLGLAYAAVPFYKAFCQATGWEGTTQVAAAAPTTMLARTVDIRFDGNVNGVPWRFGPDRIVETVRLGEKRLAFFHATNNSDVAITGRATYNVSPESAGSYFTKIQCFCFNEQTLQPHQSVEMPVVFFVNADMAKDPDAGRIEEITLSYTFFPVDKPQGAGQNTAATAQPNRG